MDKVQTLTVNGKTYQISDPDAATKEEVGDISAALDNIIALQNSYMAMTANDGGETK